MSTVYKSVIEVTVLSPRPIEIGKIDLEGIAYEINAGDSIGNWTLTSVEPIEGDALREELVAVGNDGSFFDDSEWDDAGQDDGLETHPGINA